MTGPTMNGFENIGDAAQGLRSGAITSVQLVERALASADVLDGTLGAFITRFNDEALLAAREADANFAAGIDLGPLQGIPLGVKDVISTVEATTTAQSVVQDPAWGLARGDAVVVSRLRKAGAVIVGKLTTCEFAIGLPDPRMSFPIPRNPWNLEYWAGGSSSGSASAVATGLVLGALGTDTGGSIRMPASYCGVTGLMPTYGRVPKSSCLPLGHTLDRIGPLTRTARDAAVILAVIAGRDESDRSSAGTVVPDYAAALTGDLSGVRVGFQRLDQYAGSEDPALADSFNGALGQLSALGADVVEIDIPLYEEMTSACFLLFAAEALAFHMPDLQKRWGDFSPGTRRMLAVALTLSSADYVQAQRVRRVGQIAIANTFRSVDLIVTPTTSRVADRLTELEALLDSGLSSVHTPYWNTSGAPAISVPMGFGEARMPLGLQIAARPFEESLLLRAADAFQQHSNWHLERPPAWLGAISKGEEEA